MTQQSEELCRKLNEVQLNTQNYEEVCIDSNNKVSVVKEGKKYFPRIPICHEPILRTNSYDFCEDEKMRLSNFAI